jgi:AraC family transcriptional regulator, dual regulator of chb operon
MDFLQLFSDDIIDPESEVHYTFYHSLKDTTGCHYHDFYEIFLVLQGHLVHCVNNSRQMLSEGSLVFIRPRDIHYYEKAEACDGQFINIAFLPAVLDGLFHYLGPGYKSERLLDCPQPPVAALSPQATDSLHKRLETIRYIPMTDKPAMRTQLRILLAELFPRYYPAILQQPKMQLPVWLEGLHLNMQKPENFTEGLKKMYGLCGKSPEHLCRVFRHFFGKSPTVFINELRLNYAANFLTFTDEDILSIAQNAGFENLSHFYHLFRNRFGQTPSRFRQLHQKTLIP